MIPVLLIRLGKLWFKLGVRLKTPGICLRAFFIYCFDSMQFLAGGFNSRSVFRLVDVNVIIAGTGCDIDCMCGFVKQHWNNRHMLGSSSFEARLAEADAYLKLLIDQAKVCMASPIVNHSLFSCFLCKAMWAILDRYYTVVRKKCATFICWIAPRSIGQF